MNNLLKSKAFYGIIVLIGLSIGVGYQYPTEVLVAMAILGTIIVYNFIQNQSNKRTVAQMETLSNIMNKAKQGTKSPLEKYLETEMTKRMKEFDDQPKYVTGQPNVIEQIPVSTEIPIDAESIIQ